LRLGRFELLDTQFMTNHLIQFGGIEISRAAYHRQLDRALGGRSYFPGEPLDGETVVSLLQSSTPTS